MTAFEGMRGTFWKSPSGRLEIFRHYGELYELFFNGESVMPACSFEKCTNYAWSEFDVMESEGPTCE